MVRVSLFAIMDPKHLQGFLQHVGSFEALRSGDEMHVLLHVDGGEMNRVELARILYSVNPPFEFGEERERSA